MSEQNISRLIRPMRARDPGEVHRAATPLELLYDLCFVVAIAQAAHALSHSIAHEHAVSGMISYGLVFFAIWWAWMNFTWFASAFDTDDVPYRLKVLCQMIGVVVIAAGVNRAFEEHDFTIIVIGWVILRIGMVAQWIRAAVQNREFRTTATRYAIGITVCQIGWVLMLWMGNFWWVGFIVFAACELLVPVWAEKASRTPWHPNHISERYGLLTIIVIGESVLAGVIAVQAATAGESPGIDTWCVVISSPVILFSMWWLYFMKPAEHLLQKASLACVFRWGYGHYAVFATVAAVGAALALGVDVAIHKAHIDISAAAWALAIPCAVFLLALRLMVFVRQNTTVASRVAVVVATVLLLGTPFVRFYAPAVGLILAGLTAFILIAESRENKKGD